MDSTRARPTRVRLAAVAVAALAAAGLAGCGPGPERLTVTTVVGGLDRPWDIAFAGSDMYFTEKVGRIRVLLASAGRPVRLLSAPADVVVAGEGGMMGLAVDPGFASNRRIYACFQSDAGSGLDVRVVRFRVNDAATALTERADIVTGIPTVTGRHSGCRPRFGPDGRLWIGTGDAAVNTNPQSRTSLGGKVLRVDTNGNGVSGNAPAPFDHRIYSYGHRNVQGIAFSSSGRPYSIEHGTDRDDEANLLVAGANYGWDPVPDGGGSFYDESRPMTDTGRYPNARRPSWTSGSSTIAPSGGTFLRGKQWKGWENSLAMAVLKGQQLRVVGFDGNGTATAQQWTAITNQGRLRVAVQGPNGNMYLAQDASPGAILRVAPS